MVTQAASYLYPSKLGPRMFSAGLTSMILSGVFFKEDKVLSFTKSIVIASLLRDLVLFNADKLDIQQIFQKREEYQGYGYQGYFFEKVQNNFPSRFASIAGFCVFVLALRVFTGASCRQTLISGTIFLVGYGFVKNLVDQGGDRIPNETS